MDDIYDLCNYLEMEFKSIRRYYLTSDDKTAAGAVEMCLNVLQDVRATLGLDTEGKGGYDGATTSREDR